MGHSPILIKREYGVCGKSPKIPVSKGLDLRG